MTPLALFLLGCATIFLGTVQAAFSALMRLSLRLMAERGGRSDRLGRYLDDPLQLFIPARLLIGGCLVAPGVLIARLSDIRDAKSVAVFVISLALFVIVCEHLLPAIISRRDPEAVLDMALGAFGAVAQIVRPLTAVVIDLSAARREREEQEANGAAADTGAAEPAADNGENEDTISQ